MAKITTQELSDILPPNHPWRGEYELLELIAMEINDSQDNPKLIGKKLEQQMDIIYPGWRSFK